MSPEETKISGLMKRPQEKSFFFPKLNNKESIIITSVTGKKITMKITEKEEKKKRDFPEWQVLGQGKHCKQATRTQYLRVPMLPKYQSL